MQQRTTTPDALPWERQDASGIDLGVPMIKTYRNEFERYKAMGEKAIGQLTDEGLNRLAGPETNSVGMLVRHISGNFLSRFTDFLATDGEKPWRNRDAEFAQRQYSRQEIDEIWAQGWTVLFQTLDTLTDADLPRPVKIRGLELSVDEALARSLAHVAYHIGQIVLLARIVTAEQWKWITIPKGASQAYNQAPTMEKNLK